MPLNEPITPFLKMFADDAFDPVRNEDGSCKIERRSFPVSKVKITYLSREGQSGPVPHPDQRPMNFTVEAPGINALAVCKLEFDPLECGSAAMDWMCHVSFYHYQGGEHWA